MNLANPCPSGKQIPPTTSSKSKAILEEARRLMAERRPPGIQTLADHQALRAFHKARSRQLVEEARGKKLARQDRSAARNASVNFSRI
jgi:hypothetical protein